MTTPERIQTLIRYKGMNVKTFSEFCGYDRPQVLYDVLKGKTRNISAAMCARIMAVMPEVNRMWLLTGEGEMLQGMTPAPAEDVTTEVVKTIPLVPISAIAGPLTSYYESGVNLTNCQRVVSPIPNADIAIPVSGDSMEPMFADGSILFVKRINEAAFIPWGHPMVIDTENGVFVKSLMPDESDMGFIWAVSINPRYPRMHVPKQSIAAMYRVLMATKSFVTM